MSALHRRLLTCVAAIAIVVAASAAPVGAALATDGDPRVEFAQSAIYHEQRGDAVEVGVRLSETDAATLRIGSPDERHLATVTARDADGDGRVTVRFDTYDGTFEATGEDTVAVRERSNASTPVATDSYDLELWSGNATDGEAATASRLTLNERSTDDLRTWVAPESVTLSNLTEVRSAKTSGNLTRSEKVARNDTLVLELQASGLGGALAARNDSNATARFFGLVEDGALGLEVRQINPGPSFEPAEIHLAPDSTHVVVDARNDTYYLVADLPDANVTGGFNDGELNAGDVYQANVSVAGSSALASNGTESVTTEFEVVESREEVADAATATPTTADTTTTTPTTVGPTTVTSMAVTTESPTATTATTETTAPETESEVPGFGVSAAFVALVATALLAQRRRK
ncbi:DUF7827 domain-containing protein [Halorussus amylolyticus]|uniref:DUF7827 domain-containing protein n=1 Tax=Halorussus amylolyticus TaxID=1126242 RepID=UPI0010533E26|nr:PGF-CTERM sorting domain-containing protein [Halorussus amylolyticus]